MRGSRFNLALIALALFWQCAWAQVPQVNNGAPAESFLGEQFCFNAEFSNAGNPGFGPYMQLVIPPQLVFDSASIFGASAIINNLGIFPPSPGNQINDPLINQPVTGPDGFSLITLQLPVGSVVTGGPLLELEICMTIAPSATVGVPLDVALTPVYRFGDTATGINGPIIGTTNTAPVTPTVILFEKTNDAPEQERPPGSSWPYTYSLNVNIANTAVINPIVITDVLPANVQFIGPVNIAGGVGCSVTSSPSTLTPGGSLTVTCTGNTTGTISANDVVVSYPVHIIDILDETNCGTTLITNNATLNATYVPVGGPQVLPPLNDTSDVVAKHIALQKGVSPGLATPGQTVTYNLNFQVTDFGDASALVLTDVLPDGIQYLAHGSLTVGGAALAITPSLSVAANGETTIIYDIGAVAGVIAAGTAINLSYTGQIQQLFTSTGQPILASDSLTNTAVVDYDLVQGAAACSDGSGATVDIIPVAISKSVLNPQPFYNPGDIVTFLLRMDIPSGDTGSIVFIDTFPLPVFDVTTVSTVFGTDIRLSPLDTLGLVPTNILINGPASELRIEWPDVNTTTPETIAVEVDIVVTDDPFADGLFLTNIFEASTQNTAGQQAQNNTPVQILIGAPDLRITKGVGNIDNAAATINPAAAILPVDGDATDADAGDLVGFVITVENIGSSPAFEVTVTDTVPVGLTACGVTSVTDGAGAGLAFTGDLFAAGLVLTNSLAGNDNNPPGGGAPFTTDTALINVNCTVAGTVQPLEVITNMASVTWTSQSGAISFPPQSDDASVTIATVDSQKYFVSSSEAATSDVSNPPRATIGEIVRYRLAAELIEGQFNNLQLRDQLPTGLSFLNDGSVRVAFVSNGAGLTSAAVPGIPNIAGNLADPGSIPSALISFALPAGAITGGPFNNGTDPIFNLGQVNNQDSDADAEFLVIEFNALVNNTSAGSNDAGDNRNNNFQIINNGTNLDTSNSVQVRIAEPSLNIVKNANPGSGDAGDLINYSIVVSAAGGANNSAAFETRILDNLPPQLINLSALTITPTACAAPGVVNNSAGNVIDVMVAIMEPGCSITLSFSAELAGGVNPGTSVNNSATVQYTSLPATGSVGNPTGSNTPGGSGAGDGERDGSGGVNDYAATDNANVTIQSVVLSKAVVATSEPSTTNAQFNPALMDLAIGETADFIITATLPEGTVPQVIITDTLPFTAGVMELINANVVSVGANLTPAIPAPAAVISDAQLGDGINDTVSFDFGQVINTADGVSNAADQIQIMVTGRLRDLPANSNGDTLTNNALVQFGPGLNASANAQVDVVEPLLNIVKSSPTTQGDAGDVVVFTLDITHLPTSASDAHDVLVDDVLPPGLVLVPGSLSQTSGPAADSLAEVGNGVQAVWNVLALGQSAQLQFSATVVNAVMPTDVISNLATLDWTSLPGADPNERSFSDSDTHNITVTPPGLVKTVTATSEPDTGTVQFGPEPDLTIGERATYQFSITLSEGTTNSAVVVDQLPVGSSILAVDSARIVSIGANISGPGLPAVGNPGVFSDTNVDTFNDRVTWTLGDLTNAPDGVSNANDQITFEVIAVVLDQPINQSGVVAQTNTATLTTATSTTSGTADVDLVAPDLSVVKSVTDPVAGFVDAGDTVTQQLLISHDAGSTADAYNVVITDTLPSPGLAWIGDGTVVSACPGLIIDSSAAPVIVFTIPQFALADASCTISYQVLVENAAQPTQTLTNTAVMNYDSTPVFVAGETRRLMDSDTADVTVLAPMLVKLATLSNVMDTGMSMGNPALPDLAIGETIVYEITLVLPEGTINNAVVTDLMPANPAIGIMEAIGATVTSVGGNISTTLPGTPVLDDFQLIDGLNDRVTLDFGTILNLPDGVSDANDRIVIEIVGRVADVVENTDGDLLVNNASFDFLGGSLGDSADVEVVEPSLNITKTLGPVNDGVVRVSISVANSGTAPAYDIAISDVLDDTVWTSAGLTPVSVSAGFQLQTAATGPNQTTVSVSSDPLAVSPAGTIPAGASISAVFDIPLAVLPPVPNPVTNQADLDSSDTLPGNDPAARQLPPDNDTDQIGLPDLSLLKTAVLLIDADASTDVSPGDTLRYTLTLANNGAASATNVVVDDAPDANTALVVGSVTTTQGTVTIGNSAGDTTVQVSVGTLLNPATITITYDVQIANPFPQGVTEVVNQALVDSTELPPIPSDDPTPPGGDDPTIVPVNAMPDLSITKDDGGITTQPGNTVVYLLSYQNLGNQGASGVVISETVPANTVFAPGASTAGWSCTPNNNAGSSCALAIGAVAAGSGGSVNFAVTVANPLPAGVDEVLNTSLITDDGTNGPDPTPGNNQDSDNTPVNAAPDLTIVKDDGGITTQPGATVSYTLNYQNVGNQDATGVVITETVPANSTFNAGASTAGWVCAPDNNAGSSCSLNIGALAAGASGSASFAVTVDNPLAAGVTELLNNTSIGDDGSNGPDPTPGNNASSDNTPIDATPDLVLTKDDGGVTVQPGDTIAYTLSYINVGNQAATGVVISETVPVGSSFNAGASSAGWACTPDNSAGSVCNLAIGTVNGGGAGGGVVFAVTVDNPLASGIDQIANSAVIGDDGNNGPDPTPGNNGDSDTTPVVAQPDLQLVKDDGGITAQAGDTIVYTLSYTNVGNQDAVGVVISETVPADSVFAPASSSAGWSCAPDNNPGSSCSLSIGAVAAGANGSVSFAVTVDNPLAAGVDQIANSASITDDGSNGPDPTPGDNSDSDTTPVDAVPDLVITKDDGGVGVAPGGVVIYTLSYSNVGTQAATGVVINETVPANSVFNPASSTAGWSCTPNNNAGANCSFSLGTVLGGANGSVNFAVTVDNPLPAGVIEILNTTSIVDDGGNGPDPTPGDNSDSDNTPVGAFPDLRIVKDDGGASVQPGGVVVYTLDYSNVGDQDATGVEITETVPLNTVFMAAASTPGWVCTPDGNANAICVFTIGDLDVGDTGSVQFALLVDAPLAAGITEIVNNTSITDDGSNGPDITPVDNADGDTTPISLNPPVGLKIGDVDNTGLITWTMWWFNNGNQSDLPSLILDNIPAGTIYEDGSLSCSADGTSQCVNAVFNAVLNRIEVEVVITPDFGAANDSTPDLLNNEVIISFQSRAFSSGIFENQALANWDGGNDGSPVDDQNGGQTPVMTDDPVTTDTTGDPTAVGVALAIPVFNRWGLLLLMLLVMMGSWPYLQQRVISQSKR